MIRRTRALAALALWGLWAVAGRAGAAEPLDRLVQAEKELPVLLGHLDFAEKAAAVPDEPPALQAALAFARAQDRLRAGDDAGASALLLVALDEPGFRASPSGAEATWSLAGALSRQGLTASAAARWRDLAARPGAPHAGEAAVRAMDAALRLGRPAEADALFAEAARLAGGTAPAEAAWLAGKAAWRRRDLPPAERARVALERFAAAGPPWHLHAGYGRGAVLVAQGQLGPALAELERCAAAEAAGEEQRAVRELCILGAARIAGEQRRHREAAELYARIPVGSPRHAEATYEASYAWLRAGRPDLALRHVGILADLAADAPLGPRASLLRGHLLLQAGRFTEAVESYNRVINQYAPVRDEMDAVLSLGEDPVRYFDELVGQGGELDTSAVLPPVAVKWAARRGEVDEAMALVTAIDGARRELVEARLVADRLDALLSRGYGLSASPELEAAYQRAEEAHTDAVRLESLLADEELSLLPASPARQEIEASRQALVPLEVAFKRLPSAPREMDARRAEGLLRVQQLLLALRQLDGEVAGVEAVATGLRGWVDGQRGRLRGEEERPALVEELRRHREAGVAYQSELELLRQAVNRELDVVGRGLRPSEEELRLEFRKALSRRVEAMALARRALDTRARDRLARVDAVRARLAEAAARADRLKRELLARARAAAERGKALATEERTRLTEAAQELDLLQADAKRAVGAVAARAFAEVRQSFYELVLQADVGIVDVAWTRKRQRLDRIQSLAARKAEGLSGIDAAGAGPGEGE